MNLSTVVRQTWPGLLLSSLLLMPLGCAHSKSRIEYDKQEKALTLIDKGKALEKENTPLLALEQYNRAATVYQSPVGFYQMGRVFEGQGKPPEAAAAYQQALGLSPDYQEARFALLSLGYKPTGNEPTEQEIAEAQAWAAQHASEIPMARAGAEDGQTSATDIAARRAELIEEAGQRRMPTQAEVRTVLFSTPKQGAQIPSATNPAYPNNLDVVLGTYPYHYRKAQQLGRRLLYDQAMIEYERAIQADPKQIDARLDLGDMMMKMGRQPRARYHYEQAMQDFPASPRPYLKMGLYFKQLNRRDDARNSFSDAIKKDPNFVEAYNNLAVMDIEDKQYDKASKMLDEIIKLQPDYANGYLNRGIVAETQHDKAGALQNYKRYVELKGTRPEVQKWIQDLEKPE